MSAAMQYESLVVLGKVSHHNCSNASEKGSALWKAHQSLQTEQCSTSKASELLYSLIQ